MFCSRSACSADAAQPGGWARCGSQPRGVDSASGALSELSAGTCGNRSEARLSETAGGCARDKPLAVYEAAVSDALIALRGGAYRVSPSQLHSGSVSRQPLSAPFRERIASAPHRQGHACRVSLA